MTTLTTATTFTESDETLIRFVLALRTSTPAPASPCSNSHPKRLFQVKGRLRPGSLACVWDPKPWQWAPTLELNHHLDA